MDGLKSVVGGHCTDTTDLVSQTSSGVNDVIATERGVIENFGIVQESQPDIIHQPLKNNKKHDGVKLSTVNFPNGCVKHSVDDNGLVKLDLDSRNVIVADHCRPSAMAAENCRVKVSPEKSLLSNCENIEKTDRPISEDCSSEAHSQANISTINVKSKLTYLVENLHISENENFLLSEQGHLSSQSLDVEQGIEYVVYQSELQMSDIMKLITKDLSEPYSIYTYRYFIHNWPKLCFLAMDGKKCVGSIVCKLDMHKKMIRRGYIAMLAIDQEYRRKGIGSHLVLKAIRAMVDDDCDEVVLETEITNKPALRLYENLGFVRDKRLFRYYLNGVDALRLKLWLR